MKKLFLLLVFLSFQFASAQAPLTFIAPDIHPAVQSAYDHLVERSTAHGKDYPVLLQSAGLVAVTVVDSLPGNKLAKYDRTGSTFTVSIAKVSLLDLTSLEWTLAHELGHGLKLKHETPPLSDGSYRWSAEIMSGAGVIDRRHIIYQIMTHPSYAPGIWERYFSQL